MEITKELDGSFTATQLEEMAKALREKECQMGFDVGDILEFVPEAAPGVKDDTAGGRYLVTSCRANWVAAEGCTPGAQKPKLYLKALKLTDGLPMYLNFDLGHAAWRKVAHLSNDLFHVEPSEKRLLSSRDSRGF